MTQSPDSTIMTHFAEMTDPRVEGRSEHTLQDIITIALCAVICGADSWVAVAEFGKAKEEWFATFLALPSGMPVHDTFGRVFGALDPDEFERCFLSWVQTIAEVVEGEVLAIDGKQLRRSHDKRLGKKAIHMVSAWATDNRLVLGQVKVDDKSNEITAIPRLLRVLALKGSIVTIDAMGCQKEIVETIVEQGADYAIALKENQGNLHEDVSELFAHAQETDFAGLLHSYEKTVNGDHGRIEVRECWTLSDLASFDYIRKLPDWEKLQTVAMVRRERQVNGKTTVECSYYISSLPNDAALLLETTRKHWHIENKLHWVLDIAFREDECRVRQGNAAENFAILRHIALNLLKQEQTAQCGVKTKRLKAGWDEAYLLKVLLG